MCVEWLQGPPVRGSFCITGLDPNSTHLVASLFLFVCVCLGGGYTVVLSLLQFCSSPLYGYYWTFKNIYLFCKGGDAYVSHGIVEVGGQPLGAGSLLPF